jgi:hypothetical protein
MNITFIIHINPKNIMNFPIIIFSNEKYNIVMNIVKEQGSCTVYDDDGVVDKAILIDDKLYKQNTGYQIVNIDYYNNYKNNKSL